MTDPNEQCNAFQSEWVTLQTQFDQYEKYSLLIKLFNIMLICLLLFVFKVGFWSIFIAVTIWLQDGIWKTFQHRIGLRLETIEQCLKQPVSTNQTPLPMHFNLAWSENRPGVIGLILEYIKQSLKPTVAYPHVLIVGMTVIELYALS